MYNLRKIITKNTPFMQILDVYFLNNLSDEILLNIATYLTKQELARLAMVSKQFNILTKDNLLANAPWAEKDYANPLEHKFYQLKCDDYIIHVEVFSASEVALATRNGNIIIYNFLTHAKKMLKGQHRNMLGLVKISDQEILSYSSDGIIQIWYVRELTPPRTLSLATYHYFFSDPYILTTITKMIHLSNSKIAFTVMSRYVFIIDIFTGEVQAKAYNDLLTKIVIFKYNENELIVIDADGVNIWNFAKDQSEVVSDIANLQFSDNSQSKRFIARKLQSNADFKKNNIFELSNDFVATISENEPIKILDTNTGKCLKKIYTHFADIKNLLKLPLPNGDLLAHTKNGRVYFLTFANKNNPYKYLPIPEKIFEKIFKYLNQQELDNVSKISKKFYSIVKENDLMNKVSIFPERNFTSLIDIHDINFAKEDSLSCAISFSKVEIAIAYRSGKIELWNASKLIPEATLAGHESAVRCLIKLNKNQLASGSQDNTIKIWDLDTYKCIQILKGHGSVVRCLARLNKRKIVSASQDATIKIWDIKTGTCLKTLTGHNNAITHVIVLPGNRIVSSSTDKTIKIWDSETGTCLQTLAGHSGPVECLLLLSPNEFASCSYDKTIKIWDANTFACLNTLTGHQTFVNCLARLSDKEFVSASMDGRVKIWNKDSGECINTLDRNQRPINFLAKLPDHNLLYAASKNMWLAFFTYKMTGPDRRSAIPNLVPCKRKFSPDSK